LSLYFTFTLALFNFTSVMAGRVLLILYALKLGAQPFAIGILVATYSVLPMLLSWQVGGLSDRFGSRWLLMFGAAVGACGTLVPDSSFHLFVADRTVFPGIIEAPFHHACKFQFTKNVVKRAVVGLGFDNAGYLFLCRTHFFTSPILAVPGRIFFQVVYNFAGVFVDYCRFHTSLLFPRDHCLHEKPTILQAFA
jgi:hypothetical protein